MSWIETATTTNITKTIYHDNGLLNKQSTTRVLSASISRYIVEKEGVEVVVGVLEVSGWKQLRAHNINGGGGGRSGGIDSIAFG